VIASSNRPSRCSARGRPKRSAASAGWRSSVDQDEGAGGIEHQQPIAQRARQFDRVRLLGPGRLQQAGGIRLVVQIGAQQQRLDAMPVQRQGALAGGKRIGRPRLVEQQQPAEPGIEPRRFRVRQQGLAQLGKGGVVPPCRAQNIDQPQLRRRQVRRQRTHAHQGDRGLVEPPGRDQRFRQRQPGFDRGRLQLDRTGDLAQAVAPPSAPDQDLPEQQPAGDAFALSQRRAGGGLGSGPVGLRQRPSGPVEQHRRLPPRCCRHRHPFPVRCRSFRAASDNARPPRQDWSPPPRVG